MNINSFDEPGIFPPAPHHHPLPPHLRRERINISFDEKDWDILCKVFGDYDTAAAAAKIINNAPSEMKIMAFQIIDLIKESE